MHPLKSLLRACRTSPGAQLHTAARLTLQDLNEATLNAKYAVRGKIPIRAEEIKQQLEDGADFAFSGIVAANIGNPQQLDQKPLTWYRQTLALLQYPQLIDQLKDSSIFPADVVQRATELLQSVHSVGAYSHSQGDGYVRKSVAEFIEKRDGFAANPSDIFLTGGASAAVQYLIQLLSSGPDAGFLIPIPQYPLYTATIALNNATPIPYYLDEANDWSTDPQQIREAIEDAKANGVKPKALVLINPGNPTGAVLAESDIVELVKIAAEHGLVVIADEVYQSNVFEGEFVSVKKVLAQLREKDPQTYENVQLASLHSTSKGVSGECGQRGGYMELAGFSKEVQEIIFKLASINLCSVVTGQALVELMINPPQEGSPSYALYKEETSAIHTSMKKRANLLYESFLGMTDVECRKPQGAMYLFPSLMFTEDSYPELFKQSKETNTPVDTLYCTELLESTGICCVPGNGFGQVEGTVHLRTTFLPGGSEWIESWTKFHQDFVQKYKK